MLFFSRVKRAKKNEIAEAIRQAEEGTAGEIRVHLSYRKNEPDLLAAAKIKFSHLKMHETPLRNAVLLYVNPRLKKFALFGDEGIHAKVQQEFWEGLAKKVTSCIKDKDLTHGIVHATEIIGEVLKAHFPKNRDDLNTAGKFDQ